MVMAMDELIDELQGCSGLGLWSHAGSGSQKTRLVAVGQQVDKTDAEGIERVLGGEAIDMEVVSELARARSRSHALVVGRVHASRSATCRR